jgi:oxygen-independent coproporphyrinogen-3 oxidase
MASLGVQTFNDRLLALLGRGYDASRARTACERVLTAGFDAVDIDLIFALPGQTPGEAEEDFTIAAAMEASQVSAYPLIQFHDTPLAERLSSVRAHLPSRRTERRMLDVLVGRARGVGYERSSIWSFNRPGTKRYTTVTRDTFVGIGAGASSRLGDQFRVNTFSVREYIEATRSGSPAALATHMNEGDRMAYWLFWRCYDTAVDMERFGVLFGRKAPRSVRAALQLLGTLGLLRRDGHILRLTDRGAYLFHLIEKEYTHSYLEPLWSACRREAWPEAVRF